ncbi:unnamed protein product [Merluccius merluccius]
MVATRRGVRVYSPDKTNSDASLDVQATPSTGRRTRRGAIQLDTAASEEESRNQPQESAEESAPSPENRRTIRRCTQHSRLHSPQQPSTPAGSVHEADVSDMESNCSALSDSEPPVSSRRRGTRAQPPRKASQKEEAGSEAESCSSPVSVKRLTRRSTRARKSPERHCTSQSDVGEQEANSQRVTRSTRRSTRTRASAKTPGEHSELSDADSCVSSASEALASASTANMATRFMRRAPLSQPIPLHLDTASEGSQSPAPGGRRTTRATRGNPTAASEQLSCDSEGFSSGPSTPTRRTTRSRTRATGVPTDVSDLDILELCLPPGTASGSHACSGNSSSSATRVRVVLARVADHVEEPGESPPYVPVEKAEAEPTGDESLLNESKLEHAAMDDEDCTVLEDKTITLDDEDDEEGATNADLGAICEVPVSAEMISIGPQGSVAVSASADIVMEETTSAQPWPSDTVEAESPTKMVSGENQEIKSPAGCEVTADDQQREPSTENERDGLPLMQEVLPSVQAEPEMVLPPLHSEPMALEDMEVGTSDKDAQQEDGSDEVIMLEPEQAQAEAIQVNSSQEPKVIVDAVSEPTSKDSDVVVHQKMGVISLLDSSEEEEEEEEEGDDCEVLEEDNVEHVEQERAGSSRLPDIVAPAGGLFMIDTRPGQEADEQYLKEGVEGPSQEEDDDDFVDEEVDEDDDEDAQMLLYCRNPKKELSTRIDPGLRVKELGGLYINFDGSKSKPVSNSLKKLKEQKIQDEVMKNSVMGPEFEKQSAAPPYNEAKRSLKLKRKEVKEKTTGDGWFNMKAPELTPELKADLKVIKMRGSMDPKRFYKKNDRDGLPKYFQVGTVMDSPVDFYHARVPKKDRKRTMVEELMADADFRRQNKKKYLGIMAEKAAQAAGRSKKKRLHQKKPGV